MNMLNEDIKFGTDGWRAVIADSFTFENVRITTRAIGTYILKNGNKSLPVLVSYDPRFLAKDFAICCTNELLEMGLNAKLSNSVLPTPVVAFAAASSNGKTNGAIQFTASHNPPKYCGIKYITEYGGPASEEITNNISEYLKTFKSESEKENLHKNKKIEYFDPKQDYIKHIKELIDFNKIKSSDLKSVYDPIFGAGNNYLDFILKEAGCEVITIHNKFDPLFGGLLPEPREENLNELKETVIKTGANLGLSTDGDADRLAAVDEKGIFFSPNQIVSMLLRHLYKNKKLKGSVVRTLSTTHLMDHLAKKYGLKVIETKVGFKWICEEMRKGNVLIGAEESGGISILNHIPDKDAILGGLLLVEMLAYEKKPLSEIYSDTLKDAEWICFNDKFDLHIDGKPKEQLISNLKSGKMKEVNGLKVSSINTTEGAKYLFEDGSWFLARASGTEPMARVYFEATSDKVLNAMKEAVKEVIKE